MSTDISGGPYFRCRKCGVGVNSIIGDFCLLCWNASGGSATVTDDTTWRAAVEARLSALEAAGKVPGGAVTTWPPDLIGPGACNPTFTPKPAPEAGRAACAACAACKGVCAAAVRTGSTHPAGQHPYLPRCEGWELTQPCPAHQPARVVTREELAEALRECADTLDDDVDDEGHRRCFKLNRDSALPRARALLARLASERRCAANFDKEKSHGKT